MNAHRHTKLVREKDHVAEVVVDLVESDEPWVPYLSLADAHKLDEVRKALRRGDVRAAARYGRVFRLTPVGTG